MEKSVLAVLFALPILCSCQRGYRLDAERARDSIVEMISIFPTRVGQVFHSAGYSVTTDTETVSVEYSTRSLYLHKTTVTKDSAEAETENRVESWVFVDSLNLYVLSYSKEGESEPVAVGTKTPIESSAPARELISPEATAFETRVYDEMESARVLVSNSSNEEVNLYSSKQGDMTGMVGNEEDYVDYSFSASLPSSVAYIVAGEETERTSYHYGSYYRNIPNLDDFVISEPNGGTPEDSDPQEN